MLQIAQRAPAFALRDVNGNMFARDSDNTPLTLAVFFKTTCPTCHYAWTYYERLHNAYKSAGLRVLGISQHDAERTRAYQQEYNATFPHLIDDIFTVSRAYDPALVPTSFLIEADGTIIEIVEAWNSRRINTLSEHIAQKLGVRTQQIVMPQDKALANKIG